MFPAVCSDVSRARPRVAAAIPTPPSAQGPGSLPRGIFLSNPTRAENKNANKTRNLIIRLSIQTQRGFVWVLITAHFAQAARRLVITRLLRQITVFRDIISF